MDLQNLDLLKLQTKHMQQDPTTIAMCEALTPQLQVISDEVIYCLILARVDALPENILDELAVELHIEWYDATASIDIKRSLVKNSDKVHMYMGTPYALEQVIQDYFGEGEVLEWFDYSGLPYGFKVVSNGRISGEESLNKFIEKINMLKNERSRLEGLIINSKNDNPLYSAMIVNTKDYQTTEMELIEALTWEERDAYGYTWTQWGTEIDTFVEWQYYNVL
ncbi:phage tail protein [Oxobacter pfennigii]|uniref:Phage tail protein n=1 Tax=Oxobacter pfennigii TaxID=36849 RepID=A0A0P8W181_9CLOT|nr:phage tail protein [Oxobacter pfennigii]KPU42150.1 phage tail protein [Oxobacter pfennigii]